MHILLQANILNTRGIVVRLDKEISSLVNNYCNYMSLYHFQLN